MTGFIRSRRIAGRDSAALRDLLARKGLIDQPASPEPEIPQPALPDLIRGLPKFSG